MRHLKGIALHGSMVLLLLVLVLLYLHFMCAALFGTSTELPSIRIPI